MDKCIFCGEDLVTDSVEHIFPEVIGGKWTMHICKRCNGLLGSQVDCLLTNEPLILLLRYKFQILNKNKEYVDLTKKLKYYDSDNNRVFFERGDGRTMPTLYIGQSPSVEFEDDRIIKFSGSNEKSVEKKIKREAKNRGIELNSTKLKCMLSTVAMRYNMEKVSAPIYKNILNFCPCVLKIAYESAIIFLGKKYAQDECGKKILQFLNDKMYNRLTDNEIPILIKEYYIGFAQKLHFISIVSNQSNKSIEAVINLFGCFVFVITLSNEPERYIPIKLPILHIENI